MSCRLILYTCPIAKLNGPACYSQSDIWYTKIKLLWELHAVKND